MNIDEVNGFMDLAEEELSTAKIYSMLKNIEAH